MLVYALDIGGSSVKHGLVEIGRDEATLIRSPSSTVLPSNDFSDLRTLVFEAIRSTLSSRPNVHAIGISTTGSLDVEGTVVSAGHFNGYKDVSWAKLIKPEFTQIRQVVTVNDGRASAWAEYSADPIRGKSHIHAVVGTGVGGGVVHNGELVMGDSGQAGYIGHIKVTPNRTGKCSCGSYGCVEALAAAPAIVRHFNERSEVSVDSGPGAFDVVTRKAQSGDPHAVAAFETAGYWLGVGLGNAMNVLNPAVVSVGGGVVLASQSIDQKDDGGPFMRSVGDGVAYAAHRRVCSSADLRTARFANDGGMIGAARLAGRLSE